MRPFSLILILSFVFTLAWSNSEATESTLLQLDSKKIPSHLIEKGSRMAVAEDQDGSYYLEVTFDPEQLYSGIHYAPQDAINASGQSDLGLLFDVFNPSEHSIHLFVGVEDVHGKSATRSVSIPRGFEGSLVFELASKTLIEDNGMRGSPPAFAIDALDLIWMWGSKELDLSKISGIGLYTSALPYEKRLRLKAIRLGKEIPYDEDRLVGIVDKFGQFAKTDFPGKIYSETQLRQVTAKELVELAKSERHPDRSRFGGWKEGPQLEATGYFRAQKIQGQWTLVDPEGYLYFATGIANTRMANTTTMTGIDFRDPSVRKRNLSEVTPEDSKGIVSVSPETRQTRYVLSNLRREMFNWLPSYDHPLANHYSYRRSVHAGPVEHGETFSFYQANLERRYGENSPQSYLDRWQTVTVDRMLTWGFTSMGNWTDAAFYQNNRIPYFANGWIIGDFKTVSSGNDAWSALPDVFDPKFRERAKATVAVIAEEVAGNPWCVGVFIDNEKSWGNMQSPERQYGIVIDTLARNADASSCKAHFVELLKTKYAAIDKLNAQWKTKIPSWESLANGFVTESLTKGMYPDYSNLLRSYTAQYFSIVDTALAEAMPNHMYMGVRFAHWGMTTEVVEVASEYVDVVSYNYYKECLHNSAWDFLPQIDMPSIIGEFHIGATDTGIFHPGLVAASDQADRAKMYTTYMASVIENPYFVGAHWFQYIDSPITGRAYDGENYNVGFVSITDIPYPELVAAARQLHHNLYQKRYTTFKD